MVYLKKAEEYIGWNFVNIIKKDEVDSLNILRNNKY